MSKLFERKKTKDDIQVDEVDRERSFTVVTNTQSLIEQSLALKEKPNLEVINIKPKGKEEYKKQPYCMVCFRPFSTNLRQHHCRCCANAACDPCSTGKINTERCCDVCYLRYSNTAEQERKQLVIHNLELKCGLLLRKKQAMMVSLQLLKAIKSDNQTDELSQQQLAKTQNDLISMLEQELRELDLKKTHIRTSLTQQQRQRQQLLSQLEQMQQQLDA